MGGWVKGPGHPRRGALSRGRWRRTGLRRGPAGWPQPVGVACATEGEYRTRTGLMERGTRADYAAFPRSRLRGGWNPSFADLVLHELVHATSLLFTTAFPVQ
jgi:hypothetical protein